MRKNIGPGFLVVACVALVSSLFVAVPARADAGAGAFRLSLDTSILAVAIYPDTGRDASIQFGLWGTGLVSLDSLGSVAQTAVGVGYQVTDSIVVGGRVAFGFAVIPDFGFGGDNTDIGALGLIPFFEYLFLDGNVRPFIGAQAGFILIFPERTDTWSWFVAGGLGGVHIFAADGFSISPTAFFNFLYRGSDERGGFEMILAVSFEGWLN